MSDTVRHYRSLLSDIYGPRLKSESFSDITYWPYQNQPQCIWQLKSYSFGRSILNCHKFNSNCVLKAGVLVCKNFDFLKTHKSSCTLDAIHFTSMATGRNRFSVIEEFSSHAFCRIAAPVSPRRRGSGITRPIQQSPPFLYIPVGIKLLVVYLFTPHFFHLRLYCNM